MAEIQDILRQTSHRSYPLPGRDWAYFQKWRNVFFAHWPIDAEAVQKMIPSRLNLDVFDGKAWVSLVAFAVEDLRPRFLPPFSPVSDFLEINVRTYVLKNGIPGIYFLSIEAEKYLSVWLSKITTGLPYMKSEISAQTGSYRSINKQKGFTLSARFDTPNPTLEKNELEQFLTERYALFLEKNDKLYRFDIHHRPWNIGVPKVSLAANYKFPTFALCEKPPECCHYSKGVDVLIWKKIQLHD